MVLYASNPSRGKGGACKLENGAGKSGEVRHETNILLLLRRYISLTRYKFMNIF